MAHCSKENLADLDDVFEKIRALDGLKEKSKGIFYYKSKGFLHFHEKDGKRWADIRSGSDWGKPFDIPIGATKIVKQTFLVEVASRLEETRKVK